MCNIVYSMSPVVAWQSHSPRETLDATHTSTRRASSHLSPRKSAFPDLYESSRGCPQTRQHSYSDTYPRSQLVKSQMNKVQSQNSKLNNSPAHLNDKMRKISDPGYVFPRWTEQIMFCPKNSEDSWFSGGQDCWGGTPKEKRQSVSPPEPFQLVKYRSQSTGHPPDKGDNRRVGQVWYPRDSVSMSPQKVWHPFDYKQFYGPDPWVLRDNVSDSHNSYYSSGEIPFGLWNPETTRLDPPQDLLKCFTEGLHYAMEPARTREVLTQPSLASLHYVPAGTCRIPRATVKLPRKHSRRSIRYVCACMIDSSCTTGVNNYFNSMCLMTIYTLILIWTALFVCIIKHISRTFNCMWIFSLNNYDLSLLSLLSTMRFIQGARNSKLRIIIKTSGTGLS